MGQTDLVMKGHPIMGGVVTKGLEIPPDPGGSSHKGRSRKVLKFSGPCKMHSAIPLCPPNLVPSALSQGKRSWERGCCPPEYM